MKRRPVERPLISPCCGKPTALNGAAFVVAPPELVEAVRAGDVEPPAWMLGGVHWCPCCGRAWNMRDLVIIGAKP